MKDSLRDNFDKIVGVLLIKYHSLSIMRELISREFYRLQSIILQRILPSKRIVLLLSVWHPFVIRLLSARYPSDILMWSYPSAFLLILLPSVHDFRLRIFTNLLLRSGQNRPLEIALSAPLSFVTKQKTKKNKYAFLGLQLWIWFQIILIHVLGRISIIDLFPDLFPSPAK